MVPVDARFGLALGVRCFPELDPKVTSHLAVVLRNPDLTNSIVDLLLVSVDEVE